MISSLLYESLYRRGVKRQTYAVLKSVALGTRLVSSSSYRCNHLLYVGCVHNPVLKETLVLSGMWLIFIMPVIQILYPVFFLPLLRRLLHLDAACLVNEKTRLLWVCYGQPGRYGTYVALRRILSVYLVFVFWSVFAV